LNDALFVSPTNESPDKSRGVVLLAEDNDDELLLFKRAFKRAEIKNPLQIVRDGEQAMAYLKGEGEFADRQKYPFPTLVLLDLKLPRADGFQVLRWVRSQPAIKTVRIVILSNSQDANVIKLAHELGANSFISKSPDMTEFVAQLRSVKRYWLDLSRAPGI